MKILIVKIKGVLTQENLDKMACRIREKLENGVLVLDETANYEIVDFERGNN